VRILERDVSVGDLQLPCKYVLKSDKADRLGSCFHLDGTAESVWEMFVLYDFLHDRKEYGRPLSWFDQNYDECEKTLGDLRWLSKNQFEQIRSIVRSNPAVRLGEHHDAEIVYCKRVEQERVECCGHEISKCVVRVVKRRLNMSKVEFSEPEILLELSSDVAAIESQINKLMSAPIEQPRCDRSPIFDYFKWWVYLVGKILFVPAGLLMIPLTLVLTNIIGLLCALPVVGLPVLMVLTVIWQFFYLPLYALSIAQVLMPFLAPVISVIGFPIAYIGRFVVGLFPNMGERKAKAQKVSLLDAWPYTFEMRVFQKSSRIGSKCFAKVLADMISTPGDEGALVAQLIRNQAISTIIRRQNEEIAKITDGVDF